MFAKRKDTKPRADIELSRENVLEYIKKLLRDDESRLANSKIARFVNKHISKYPASKGYVRISDVREGFKNSGRPEFVRTLIYLVNSGEIIFEPLDKYGGLRVLKLVANSKEEPKSK